MNRFLKVLIIAIVIIISILLIYTLSTNKNKCSPACVSPQTCVNGSCQSPSICSPACVSPQTCVNGSCQSPSICSPACVSPQTCVNGSCQSPSICSPACVSPQKCVNGSCQDNIIDFESINNKFKTTQGLLVVMNPYKTDIDDQNKQIYLENNVFDSNDHSEKIIATTYLTEKLPLGVYATRGTNTTIGIILDPTLIYANNWIKCMQVTDANSVNRACNTTGEGGNPGYPCTCTAGVDCKSGPDYKAVQAGCGVYCWDNTKQCNTVNWCDNYNENDIINNYTNGTWNGVGQNCMFRPPPNDLFVNAAIAWRKSQPNGPGPGNYWLETELDGVIDITDDNKNLWLQSIIGVFHTSDPGYMCQCQYCGTDQQTYCCNDNMTDQLECQKSNCNIGECQKLSIQTVKGMVNEYNTKISNQTGHKIKAWSLKNINRHSWNGWNENTNYTVTLSDFLEEQT